MNKARVAEAARGIIQKKNVRKDLKVDFILHKGIKVYPNLKCPDPINRIEDPDRSVGRLTIGKTIKNGTKQRARNQKIPTSQKGFFVACISVWW